MTGGRLKRVRDYLGDESLLLHLRRRRRRRRHRRADRTSIARTASWRRHGGPAARALRRAGDRRRRRDAVSSRSRAGDGGWINGGFFVLVAEGASTTSTATRRSWEREPLERSRARASWWRFSTAASGSRWTPCATRSSSRNSGRAAARRGRRGHDASAFWRGRRVLVTGHTGFKGSWLALCGCSELGAEVTGYSRLRRRREPNLFDARPASRRTAATTSRDVRDRDALQRAMPQRQPEIVFHLAAQPLVRASYRDPVETFATNVMGTVNVLEAVRAAPSVRAVVVVTTDKCYENQRMGVGLSRERAAGRPRSVLAAARPARSW